MSVPASQRPQSKAEFVIRARDLLIYSIKKSKGLEKSLTFFGKQSLYETAQKIHEDVVSSFLLFMKNTRRKRRFENRQNKRKKNFPTDADDFTKVFSHDHLF